MSFTIRRLMIVVAVVAVLFANLAENGWLATEILDTIQESGWPPLTVISFFSLDFFGARWLVVRGWRRPAAVGFWILAVLANTLYVACCIAPSVRFFQTLRIGWFLVFLPTMTGLGLGLGRPGHTRTGGPPPPRPGGVALGRHPGLAADGHARSCWPLRLAFLAARPTLERLADRVVAGQSVSFPQQVGVFRLVESGHGPVYGNVALIIDPTAYARSGFVRIPPWVVAGAKLGAPIFGSYLDLDLGGGWRYRLGR